MQKFINISALLIAFCFAGVAQAECFAEYKAKRNQNGLELHYGVIRLSDAECVDAQTAKRAISSRVGVDGWTVLRVVSKLTATEASNRQADAGQYYLKY